MERRGVPLIRDARLRAVIPVIPPAAPGQALPPAQEMVIQETMELEIRLPRVMRRIGMPSRQQCRASRSGKCRRWNRGRPAGIMASIPMPRRGVLFRQRERCQAPEWKTDRCRPCTVQVRFLRWKSLPRQPRSLPAFRFSRPWMAGCRRLMNRYRPVCSLYRPQAMFSRYRSREQWPVLSRCRPHRPDSQPSLRLRFRPRCRLVPSPCRRRFRYSR